MNKIVSLVIVLSLFACGDKTGTSFTVTGNITNGNVRSIYLEANRANRERPVVLDSAHINKDGSFTLTTNTKEEGLYSLRTDRQTFPFAVIVNDAKAIKVNADFGHKPNSYIVEGSPASQGIIDFDRKMGVQARELYLLAQAIDSLSRVKNTDNNARKITDSIRVERFTEYQAGAEEMKNYTASLIEKSKSPSLVIYSFELLQRMFENFGMKGFTKMEASDIANKVAARFPGNTSIIEWKNKTASVKKAPEFSLMDTSGKEVALSSFRGKYVLVDFWASWCEPCREENPNVVAAYNRFRDKNFTILGVSLDKSKDAWVKAIRDDGLTWNHVSDLQFWNSEPAALYGVTSIPYNFLLDPDGNIIAEDIRGQELFNTLGEVLK